MGVLWSSESSGAGQRPSENQHSTSKAYSRHSSNTVPTILQWIAAYCAHTRLALRLCISIPWVSNIWRVERSYWSRSVVQSCICHRKPHLCFWWVKMLDYISSLLLFSLFCYCKLLPEGVCICVCVILSRPDYWASQKGSFSKFEASWIMVRQFLIHRIISWTQKH